MTTSADVRLQLVEALQNDLVGPGPNDRQYAREKLTQSPSKWYLTGFLAPFGIHPDLKSDDTVSEQIDVQTSKVLGEDNFIPETTAVKKAPFPSSMGLSFLISETVTAMEAEISWGDYFQAELKDDDEGKESKIWERQPHSVNLRVPISSTNQSKEIDIPNSDGLRLIIANRPINSQSFPMGTRSVSIFLVNYRKRLGRGNQESSFAFQTHLSLECTEGFTPRSDPRGKNDSNDWDEAVASLQHRYDYEFAVGHNVSAIAQSQGKKCQKICTTWLPIAEVARVAPASFEDVELGMETIAAATDALSIQKMFNPLVITYEDWIVQQRQTPLEAQHQQVSDKLLDNATKACNRITEGLKLLEEPDVLEAFKIANKAIAIARRKQLSQEQNKPEQDFDPPQWRPFQLAFILLNLVSMAEPEHKDRQTVDLLFFPTGGGKTEAYLGLAAFTLVLRRLRYPGINSAGLSVLMRYTLRLLTLDQLERASRLICALELERMQNNRLGSWPFEIGLWVGSGTTPNKMGKKGDKDDHSALKKTQDYQKDTRNKPCPIPMEKCPWCGTKFTPNSFELFPNDHQPQNLRIHCCNRSCDFHSDRHESLPILTVDETIYRRLPCFIIATVDKFASLPWVGQTAALFGKVTYFREAEGFYGPAEPDKRGRLLTQPLPPPDLIIQDELHLISGPLGTMVGLYETAIDTLCNHPKIIASTATVRRAEKQIQALFNRSQVDIFPPPGPDRHDSFFAKTEPIDFTPGRLYLGVAAQGRSLKVIMLRVYLALLASAQKQWEQANAQGITPNPAEPYMTLLGYFNSLRELGGSRRIVEDEVTPQLSKYGDRKTRFGETASPYFSNRKIDDEPQELTSRVSTDKVAQTKNNLSQPFSFKKGKKEQGVDVVLATNMISVGLDIVRLGLMVVLGQPKSASEYIQSTSRVGRDVKRPGLVVTLLNIHRHRDRSHYERFQGWHNSFYRAVEATSVTPFSPRALDRGLAAVFVALARLHIPSMTEPLGASNISLNTKELEQILEIIVNRARTHNSDLPPEVIETLEVEIHARITDLLKTWTDKAEREQRLQYDPKETDGASGLLLSAFSREAEDAPLEQQKFKAQRSLRDVEPTVTLWIKDLPEELGS
ncbi:DISARM system helicase DrmA [Gloeocapsa sp. PCC 73106]|uniref:DISARM system helicase DrmA n=1 Tax=Gloeocapsa sp. PCC 73106 TaxID=102232 RepID=UPI0002ACDDF8|nr:DISARM system helicase DrmA [Gloeocapsa sp. PCC 73106]ELR96530.1 helicase family protein with metal-binding cysteine cluster [Gloeocapsa sp. PCC 73106]